jgi:tetratricopeptide (TPR) repeat protein
MKQSFLIAGAAALIVAVIVAFQPSLHNDFTHYDDQFYITDNEQVKSGINWAAVKYAFSAEVVSNWHPLTMLSHMLDCQLFGLDPLAHHAMGIFYHILNTILLFLIFYGFSKQFWPAFAAVLLFAVHPLRVESVAWASERKDLLCGFFYLLSIFLYYRYVMKRSLGRYLLILLSFLLALLSKPMAVTLPFALLLLDYTVFNRFSLREAVFNFHDRWKQNLFVATEKLPMLALAAAFSAIAFMVQREGNAVAAIPFAVRFLNAFIAYLIYLKMFLWPINLAMFYPHSYMIGEFSWWQGWSAFIVVCMITALFLYNCKRMRYLCAAWFWYAGLLVPVIGFVQVGDQVMADRYTYLPMMSIGAAIAFGSWHLIKGAKTRQWIFALVTIAVAALLSMQTRKQTATWRDDITLFGHAVSVTEKNSKIHYNLGVAFRENGKQDDALKHFLLAKQYNPYNDMVYMDIATLYMQKGRLAEMNSVCQELIDLNPKSWYGYYGRGLASFLAGDMPATVTDLSHSLSLAIADTSAIKQIAVIAMQAGDTTLANRAAAQLQ